MTAPTGSHADAVHLREQRQGRREPAVKAFVDLYLSEDGLAAVTDAGYVALPDDQWAASQSSWAAVG